MRQSRPKCKIFGQARRPAPTKACRSDPLWSPAFRKSDFDVALDDNEYKKIESPQDDETKIQYSPYGFLRPGIDLQKLKAHLSKEIFFVYLPGGIVGKQSFYTILENTIRNVKHVKEDSEIKKIKEEGIDFYLTITPVGEKLDNEFFIKWFKIEIYLKHKSNLKDDEGMIDVRINKITRRSIVDEIGNPRMGGNSQDKICAAMLYRNDFDKVEEVDKECNEIGPNKYPWITTKGISNGADSGYLSRYFYLWKGDFSSKKIAPIRENISRFKFHRGNIDKARNSGLIRYFNDYNQIDKIEIYKKWLEKWFKDKKYINIFNAQIDPDSKKEVFYFSYSFTADEGILPCQCAENKAVNLKFFHGPGYNPQKGILNYRNHGDFVNHFNNGDISENSIPYYEFMEMILTRIAIIDNRLFNLFDKEVKNKYKDGERKIAESIRLKNLREHLLIEIYPEVEEIILKESNFIINEELINKYNFIIIHLSFIENFLNFTEENVEEFITNRIINVSDPKKLIPENFILVVTTARGRSTWWEKLEKSKYVNKYKKFVTFRPIEAISNAISDGIYMNDDFQIKYNLTKLLFGS